MPKRNSSLPDLLHKHHLIPSTTGGIVAYFFSGIVMLALLVFAAVWIGSAISHSLHKK